MMHLTTPLFMAVDDESFQFIRKLKGHCIFYNYPGELSFYYQREVWILYSHSKYFHRALLLGRQMQQAGSKKVLIILIGL